MMPHSLLNIRERVTLSFTCRIGMEVSAAAQNRDSEKVQEERSPPTNTTSKLAEPTFRIRFTSQHRFTCHTQRKMTADGQTSLLRGGQHQCLSSPQQAHEPLPPPLCRT